MDRDVGSTFPTSPADAVPPYAPEMVRTAGVVGIGLTTTAAVLGLVATGVGESAVGVLNTARVFLVFIGVVTAIATVSMRPDLWWSWALGAATAGLGVGGLPGSWDSFRLLLAVLAGVAATGVAFRLLPPAWRFATGSVLVLFHFTGIFLATTAPPASPWLTDQLYSRVYTPYLQFVYLRNAYHFYSPEPGPASILAFLLKTETGTDPSGKKTYKTQWVVLPKRPADVRDPLGLSYYRMLSLTEQAARGSAGLVVPTDQIEKSEMWVRREQVQSVIPYNPVEPKVLQYKLPPPDVTRYVLPSYASHVILMHTPDRETAAKTTVKVYRLEHKVMPPDQLSKGLDPYHPRTYRPYFLGEFDARGHLVDPKEELLYWMLPVIPRTPSPNDPYKKEYYDYLSVHALEWSPNEVLAADEAGGQVFNWRELK